MPSSPLVRKCWRMVWQLDSRRAAGGRQIQLANYRTKKGKYTISKHRFWQCYHFAMQYNEWRDELKFNDGAAGSIEVTGMPSGSGGGNTVQQLAIRRDELLKNCESVEQVALEADAELYPYILKAVTNDWVTFRYLEMVAHIPCSINTFTDRKQKFYYLLSKKI